MRANPTLFPLNLQYFAEGDPAATPPTTPPPAEQPKGASAEDIAAAVLKAVGDRTARAETGVLKSMAEQYGMSEADLKAVLDKHKAEAATKLPPEAQKKLDDALAKAQGLILAAEVKTLGATMGLVDAEAALQLWDGSKVKVTDDGKVEGAKDALEALKTAKPYLFGTPAKPGAMAEKMGGQGAKPEKTPQEEARELMYHK